MNATELVNKLQTIEAMTNDAIVKILSNPDTIRLYDDLMLDTTVREEDRINKWLDEYLKTN